MWRNWRIHFGLATNKAEKHVIYNSIFLVVAIFNTISINNMRHSVDSFTVHNVPRHMLFTADQTGILYKGFSLPICQCNLTVLPKSRFHIVILVIES